MLVRHTAQTPLPLFQWAKGKCNGISKFIMCFNFTLFVKKKISTKYIQYKCRKKEKYMDKRCLSREELG